MLQLKTSANFKVRKVLEKPKQETTCSRFAARRFAIDELCWMQQEYYHILHLVDVQSFPFDSESVFRSLHSPTVPLQAARNARPHLQVNVHTFYIKVISVNTDSRTMSRGADAKTIFKMKLQYHIAGGKILSARYIFGWVGLLFWTKNQKRSTSNPGCFYDTSEAVEEPRHLYYIERSNVLNANGTTYALACYTEKR